MPLILLILALFAAPLAARAELTEPQLDELVALYERLHREPELSFYEAKTAERLVGLLRPLGFAVTERVGGHGFVAVLENGAGPTVMVRTDLDGLPVAEETGRPYASDVRVKDDLGRDVGVMHACAHDIHMSAFIGVARRLVETRMEWRGTLVMIGQPAEERGAGARAMLADGLFERFPRPDYALALHSHAGGRTGAIYYSLGPALASVDSVDVTVRGVGGHGAYPHLTVDPVVLAAQIVLGWQTIVSRRIDPLESAVVTVGSIHGGAKHNVISEEVKLQLTVRSYNEAVRRRILDSIREIALHTARAAGVPPEREPAVEIAEGEYTPATINDAALGRRLLPAWQAALGAGNVVEIPPVMGGEDFSRYGMTDPRVPIFIFFAGTIDPERYNAAQAPGGEPLPSLHSPRYWPEPRESIRAGVRAMTAAARELLGRP